MKRLARVAGIGLVAVGISPAWAGNGEPAITQTGTPGTPVIQLDARGSSTAIADPSIAKWGKEDFISLGGGVYFPSNTSAHFSDPDPPLAERDLGPEIGRVLSNDQRPSVVDYAYELCYEPMPDWQAPFLEVGTPVYAVRGYATTYRLATRREGKLVLYSLYCHYAMKVGADLFDLRGRVERVRADGAVIDDPATVAELVELVLTGAILPEEMVSTGPASFTVKLELDDGSGITMSIVEPDQIRWWPWAIEVPPRFFEILRQSEQNASSMQATLVPAAGVPDDGPIN